MRFICFSGKAQAGKTTSADFLVGQLRDRGKKVLKTSYGDLVKYVATKFFGWNGVKDEAGRTLLQTIGTDAVRAKYPNFWVNFILMITGVFESKWEYVVIDDARFPNEILQIREKYEVAHVKVVRDGYDNGLTDEQKHHSSETSLDDALADIYIDNSGDKDNLEKEVFWRITSWIDDGQISIDEWQRYIDKESEC